MNTEDICQTGSKLYKACYNKYIAGTPCVFSFFTHSPPMNYFFESLEDYAAKGGVITDAVTSAFLDPCDAWEESFEVTDSYEDTEYREDRYEQMASRHGC